MQFIRFSSYEDASNASQRIYNHASSEGLFSSGTTAYANPTKEEFWTIPVIPGFERFFTASELEGSERLDRVTLGLKIIDELLVYLDSDLSVDDVSVFLNRITSVIVMLQSGSLQAAKVRAEAITTTIVYSQTRKNWLISKINGFIS